ncbi:MAG: carboxylating nicotinate-nucleotide diphosphorylase [Candidatus Micrarchaeota archaeon]
MGNAIVKLFSRDFSKSGKIFRQKAQLALSEDANKDLTTKALGLKGTASASIIAEEQGILCGLYEAKAVLSNLQLKTKFNEGDLIKKGDTILEIRGDISEILRCERTALNYLQILSGIATKTHQLSATLGRNKIAALRKNHPLMTESEKRAVQIGGGLSHRISLSDGYLIKNNHLDYLRKKMGVSPSEAVAFAIEKLLSARKSRSIFIEIEVTSKEEALAAATTRADAILLDNMEPWEVDEIAKAVRKLNKNIILEASGGITPELAARYLVAGADFVSMSHLVLRNKPLSMHLRLD